MSISERSPNPNEPSSCCSATREETHLIAVVLGAETSQIRNKEVAKILDYGFANYKTEVIAEEKEVMSMAYRCAPWTYQHYAQKVLAKLLRIC